MADPAEDRHRVRLERHAGATADAEPPARKAGVKVDSVDTLIAKLKTEAKVI
jgi:hypothetical protein